MKEFDNALANYVREFANGGAIRHFVDLGYSVNEIKSSLDFPATVDDIAQCVWDEYVATKIVCLDENDLDKEYIVKTDYVKDYNKYGKTSLRKVSKKVAIEPKTYIPCEFGKIKYKDKALYEHRLGELEADEREMIEYLPWPLTTVYVDAGSRLGEAVEAFGRLNIKNIGAQHDTRHSKTI